MGGGSMSSCVHGCVSLCAVCAVVRAAVTRSAYKGKQATTAPPKRIAAAQEGVFSKMTYASDPFDDTTGTLKEEPLDKRKLGAYTARTCARACVRATPQRCAV
ncbi:hypothetical protein EON67_10305, partial [archaeon]